MISLPPPVMFASAPSRAPPQYVARRNAPAPQNSNSRCCAPTPHGQPSQHCCEQRTPPGRGDEKCAQSSDIGVPHALAASVLGYHMEGAWHAPTPRMAKSRCSGPASHGQPYQRRCEKRLCKGLPESCWWTMPDLKPCWNPNPN